MKEERNEKNTIALKGFSYADGVHWYWKEKEIAIIDQRTSEIEWCVRRSSLPNKVIDAIREKKPKTSGVWMVEARRIRQSVTQGEIHVIINGVTVAVFADDICINAEGNYESTIPDEEIGRFVNSTFWHPYDNVYHTSDCAKDVFYPNWRKDTGEESYAPKEKIHVSTPVGVLYAYPSADLDYPGIYIDLHRDGYQADAPLLLIDFSKTEFPECRQEQYKDGVLVCRCWKDVTKDDYDEKDRVVFKKYETFFRNQKLQEEFEMFKKTDAGKQWQKRWEDTHKKCENKAYPGDFADWMYDFHADMM